jgi:hypothetical protein
VPAEKPPEQRAIDWAKIIDIALAMPGSVGTVYNRFYNYSYANQALLWMQGAREPVATLKRWNALGRTVLSGSKAFEIIIPLFSHKPKDTEDEEAALIGFKSVRRIFTLSQTDGDELPSVQIPEWNVDDALRQLGITRMQFRRNDSNVQGYARGREVAINPFAVHPNKTLFHEVGHIVLGHTTPEMLAEYEQHRGIFEFQAEATAHLAMNELGQLTDEMATHSRGYIQDWLKGERPPDKAIREVFRATDVILKAGRLAVDTVIEGA